MKTVSGEGQQELLTIIKNQVINTCSIMINQKKNCTLSIFLSTMNTDGLCQNQFLALDLNLLKIYKKIKIFVIY